MSYTIALNFEDGVTRFIDCKPGEKVADAAYRVGINIPLDCRDGACGTCKCLVRVRQLRRRQLHRGRADRGGGGGRLCARLPDDAEIGLRAADRRLLRRLQDRKARASPGRTECRGSSCRQTAIAFSLKVDPAAQLRFLPGQYVNIAVPGHGSDSVPIPSARRPARDEVTFLIRDIPPRADEHLAARPRQAGNARLTFTGPSGSFYLRDIKRPGADAGRRHRPGAVPVDARQDRRRRAASSRSTWSMA